MIRLFKRRPAPAAAQGGDAASSPKVVAPVFPPPVLETADGPTTATGWAFQDIIGELINQHLVMGRRGLALCGPSSGAGVSFAAANLAGALAHSGVATLLIEANMREPSLAATFGAPATDPGLLQFLASPLGAPAVTKHEVLPNLSVILAGGRSDEADDLVSTVRFQTLVSDAMRDYQCVIVDTPPANRFADCRTIAVAVGYAVIVGRLHHSYLDDVKLLSDQLEQVGVTLVGSIFNDG